MEICTAVFMQSCWQTNQPTNNTFNSAHWEICLYWEGQNFECSWRTVHTVNTVHSSNIKVYFLSQSVCTSYDHQRAPEIHIAGASPPCVSSLLSWSQQSQTELCTVQLTSLKYHLRTKSNFLLVHKCQAELSDTQSFFFFFSFFIFSFFFFFCTGELKSFL